jgi:hypothetical protein
LRRLEVLLGKGTFPRACWSAQHNERPGGNRDLSAHPFSSLEALRFSGENASKEVYLLSDRLGPHDKHWLIRSSFFITVNLVAHRVGSLLYALEAAE